MRGNVMQSRLCVTCAAVGAALAAGLTASARAATLDVAATPTVISDGEGSSRVLLEIGDLSRIRGKVISRATLEVDLPSVQVPRSLPVQVSPVLSSWTAGSASWSSPWTNEGGDLDDAYYDIVTLDPGSTGGKLRLDVSSMIRAMAVGEIGEYGLALTVPEYRAVGFRSDELAALGSLSSATIHIDYRARSKVAVAEQTRGPVAKSGATPTAKAADVGDR
jgi:hypothetical protein